MIYLTVGTDIITKEQFIPIKNGDEGIYKPTGGLWLTEYDINYDNYNTWVEYLIDNPSVLLFKSRLNPWSQPCSVVKLKDDANIFNLKTQNDFEYLMDKYPTNNSCFSYETMCYDYDGINVNLFSLITNNNKKEIFNLIRQYCVNTLLLYNLDCIEYYHPAKLSIKPFNIDYPTNEEAIYKIAYDKIKKRVM